MLVMFFLFTICKRSDNGRTKTSVKIETKIIREEWNEGERKAAAAEEHTYKMEKNRHNNKIDDDDGALPMTITLKEKHREVETFGNVHFCRMNIDFNVPHGDYENYFYIFRG